MPRDYAFNRSIGLKGPLQLTPDLELLGLRPRQHHRAVIGLGAVEKYVDLVAFIHRDVAVGVNEFGERHLALAFVIDIDDDVIAGDEQDTAGQDISWTRRVEAFLHQRLKFIVSSVWCFEQTFLHLFGTFRAEFDRLTRIHTTGPSPIQEPLPCRNRL